LPPLKSFSKAFFQGLLKQSYQNVLVGLALSVLFFLLYFYTRYPEIGGRVNFGDSAKWQFLWAIGGTPHAPGYPLFLMLTTFYAKTLTFLAPNERLLLLNIMAATGAVFFCYKIAALFTIKKHQALIAPLLFGSSITFWSQATEVEVYALNAFFLALVSFFYLQYAKTTHRSYLYTASFFYALSFGNHLTMITLLPAIIYLVWQTQKTEFWRVRTLVTIGCFILLGFSQYFYLLYLSHQGSPNLEYIGEKATLARWFDYITAKQWADELTGYTLKDFFITSLPSFLKKAVENIHYLGIAATILFLSLHFVDTRCTQEKCQHTQHRFLILSFFGETLYCLHYQIPDIEVYYIPSFFYGALFSAFLVQRLPTRWLQWFSGGLFFLLSFYHIQRNILLLKETENPRTPEIHHFFTQLPQGTLFYLPQFEQRYDYSYMMIVRFDQYIAYPQKIEIITAIPENQVFYLFASEKDRIDTSRYQLQFYHKGVYPSFWLKEAQNLSRASETDQSRPNDLWVARPLSSK
jgi:Protein of unknown function (DUF2723)